MNHFFYSLKFFPQNLLNKIAQKFPRALMNQFFLSAEIFSAELVE